MSQPGVPAPAPPAGYGRRILSALRSRTAVETVAVLAGFAVLAVFMTWPLARHFDSQIAGGGGGGDASGYVWDLYYNATHGLRLWGVSVQDTVSAPFGRVLPGSANTLLLVTVGPAWVITTAFSPVVAYNTMMLTGITLSASSMYLLVRWLRLGVGPAIWGGFSFVLFPQEILRVLGHLPLVQLECFPLMIMAGLHWVDRPGRRRAVLVALALAFAWLTNPYYGVMCTIMATIFGLWGVWGTLRGTDTRAALVRAGELAGACVILVGLPLVALFASARGAVDSVFKRQEVELLLYGAQPTDYIRPLGSNVVWSTVFGSPFPSPSGERLNYVGVVTIALALVGLGVALWRGSGIDPRRRRAALTVIPMVPVLVLFSLASPMTWFGHTIDMPSKFVFTVLPFLRVFARFVVPVMAVLLAAGAVGLWYLLRGRSDVWRVSLMSAVLLVTAADLPAPLPVGSAPPATIAGVAPAKVPTWAWLRDNAEGQIVFDLPGRPNEQIERFYMYGQLVHGHPIAGGGLFPGQLGYDFVNQTGDPRWPNSARWMSSVGIDLVTINPWAYALIGQKGLDPAAPPEGFAVEKVFPDGSAVWRVTAPPADAVPVFRQEGWWNSETLPDGMIWRWMDDGGRITVVAPAPGLYRMSFRARGLDDQPYPLQISLPDGSTKQVTVTGDTLVTLPVRLSGTEGDVVIDNRGPASRNPAPGDARRVSVQVSEPVLTRVD